MAVTEVQAIIGVGVATVAVMGTVALVGYLNLRNTTLYNLPKLIPKTTRPPDGDPWMELSVKAQDGRPEWLICSVAVCSMWPHKYLAGAVPGERDSYNQVAGYRPDGQWRRRIRIDPPAQWCVVAIHSEAPDCSISVNICLSSAPSKRTSLDVRYRSN